MRAVDEWVGKVSGSSIPPRVRLRVFETTNGRCRSCSKKILAGERWECDHVVPLINGGEHRERNLQPLCVNCHKAKTREDVREKSKVARVRKKHLGLHKKSSQWPTGKDKPWKSKIGGGVERR